MYVGVFINSFEEYKIGCIKLEFSPTHISYKSQMEPTCISYHLRKMENNLRERKTNKLDNCLKFGAHYIFK